MGSVNDIGNTCLQYDVFLQFQISLNWIFPIIMRIYKLSVKRFQKNLVVSLFKGSYGSGHILS